MEIGPGEHPLNLLGRELVYFDMPGAENSVFKRRTLENAPVIEGDAETLSCVPSESFDFIASSHVLEHCRRPISTVKNWSRVLRPKGILWIAVPLKDHCFDRDRKAVELSHLIADEETFDARAHYRDWFENGPDKMEGVHLAESVEHALHVNSNIHFHAWDGAAWLEFFCYLWRQGVAKVEESVVNDHEVIFVLRKP